VSGRSFPSRGKRCVGWCVGCALVVLVSHPLIGVVSVQCVMCPFEDGAFKQTCDGRWVSLPPLRLQGTRVCSPVVVVPLANQIHVVCAVWYPGTWIEDLSSMGPVNVSSNIVEKRCAATVSSERELQRLLDAPHSSTSSGAGDTNDSLVTSQFGTGLCAVCKLAHGKTIRCTFSGCEACFHPLCAWYDGAYMRADSVRQVGGTYRGGGAIPGSLHIRCMRHVPVEAVEARRSAQEQAAIRQKYRVSVTDVDAEDKAQRRRERRRKRKQGKSGSTKTKAKAHVPRAVMKGDVYADGVCAVCFDSASATNKVRWGAFFFLVALLWRWRVSSCVIFCACRRIGPIWWCATAAESLFTRCVFVATLRCAPQLHLWLRGADAVSHTHTCLLCVRRAMAFPRTSMGLGAVMSAQPECSRRAACCAHESAGRSKPWTTPQGSGFTCSVH